MKQKSAKKRVGLPISIKMVIIVFISLLCSTIFIGWLTYNASKTDLVSSLKDSLEKVAATASISIDGNVHQTITSPDDNAYKAVQLLLEKIKNGNALDAPLYTLKRASGRNEVECVVTTEPVNLIGARYKMRNEISRTFRRGIATSTDIYRTKTGTWISAYGPIKDNLGVTVAALKIQHHAGYIQDALYTRLLWVIFFCSIAFAVGSLLSLLLIRQITASIEKLNNAALALELGDYDTRIKADSNDEIGQLALTLEKMRLSLNENIQKLKDAWFKEKKAHLESILTLSKAIEIRDPYTRGHIERVSHYSVLIAKKMGISDEKIEELKYGCMLHDLGKLNVNIDILEKSTSLDTNEWEDIRRHPAYGAEIIKGIKFLNVAREITLYHHERYDGKGYPFGLKGDKIPLLARIVSLADAFDAMVSDRPYRKRMSDEEVFSTIKSEAGKQFDPEICYIFLELKDEITKIKEQHKD